MVELRQAQAMATALAVVVLTSGTALAQQSVYLPQPRHLPPALAETARPISESQPHPADRPSDGHFPVRLASAAEPIAPTGDAKSLKLAPRTQNAGQRPGRPIAPTAEGAIGTVAGSLGVVLGLFLILVWCSRKFAPAGSAQLPKEVVELLGRSSLGGRQQVQLVRIGNKLLLVAITTTGMESLAEITDPVEVERLAGLCRRGQSASASSSFNQVLGQLAREPVAPGASAAARARSRGAT
jgi:flagellar biogenesis protein FliO